MWLDEPRQRPRVGDTIYVWNDYECPDELMESEDGISHLTTEQWESIVDDTVKHVVEEDDDLDPTEADCMPIAIEVDGRIIPFCYLAD